MENEMMSTIRARLLLTQPFYGTLAMHLQVQEITGLEVIARTNGTLLQYNPEEMKKLTPEEQIGVVAHEVTHCALGHPWRMGSRDVERWNVACDYAINPLILDAGLSLPSGVLNDPQYAGMAAEQIYSLLPEDDDGQGSGQEKQDSPTGDFTAPAGGEGQNDGQGQSDGQGDGKGTPQGQQASQGQGNGQDGASTGQGQMSEADWQVVLEQATRIAQAAGHLPGNGTALVDTVRVPKVDWRQELRDFIVRANPSDYSWTAPNRRQIAAGLYLPGTVNEQLGPIVLGVDCSDSTRWLLKQFAPEFAGVIEEARPEKVVVVYWDAKVQATEEYSSADGLDYVKMQPKGFGGTLPNVMFDWVREHDIDPMALVCLTDLEFGGGVQEPEYPVLWAVPDACCGRTAPFGEVVRIPRED